MPAAARALQISTIYGSNAIKDSVAGAAVGTASFLAVFQVCSGCFLVGRCQRARCSPRAASEAAAADWLGGVGGLQTAPALFRVFFGCLLVIFSGRSVVIISSCTN